jgi:hypothetical protein
VEDAGRTAGRPPDTGSTERLLDDLKEAEAAGKQTQLDKLNTDSGAQEEQLKVLETRLNDLISKAQQGIGVNVDVSQAVIAVDSVKAHINAIPDNTEKTITVTTACQDQGTPLACGNTEASAAGFFSGRFTGNFDHRRGGSRAGGSHPRSDGAPARRAAVP